MEGLSQPFGMALIGDTFYVGNTDGVVAFPYTAGADRITAPRAASSPPSSPPGTGRAASCRARRHQALCRRRLAHQYRRERAWRPRRGRAAIYELDLATVRTTVSSRPACAMRSASPGSRTPTRSGPWSTSATASATRRRRTISTSVRDGGFYGWPYWCHGQIVDASRVAGRGDGRQGDPAGLRARRPHRLARPAAGCRHLHAARLSATAWRSASTARGIASTLSGYKVVFVPFENGRLSAPGARHPCCLPRARRKGGRRRLPGRRRPSAPTARCWSPTTGPQRDLARVTAA